MLVASSERAADVLGWRPARPSLAEMVGSAWALAAIPPGRLPRVGRQVEPSHPWVESSPGWPVDGG